MLFFNFIPNQRDHLLIYQKIPTRPNYKTNMEMMMESPSLQIDFQLLGTTISPKEISKILEIIPDIALLQGERSPRFGLPKSNIWSIRSKSPSDEILEHWRSLEPALVKAKDRIREIAKTGRVKITIIIEGKGRTPSLTIPPEMSEFAGFVRSEIDIDHLQC